MTRTSTTHALPGHASQPTLTHGARWTISAGTPPYRVRAYRDQLHPTKLRVVDVTTRRPVLKVTNRPGSDALPAAAVLTDLLRWTDPGLADPLTRGLSGLCWRLNETATGFELTLRTRSEPGTRPNGYALPVTGADRAAADTAARTLLALAQAGSCPAGDVPSTAQLEALRHAIEAGRRR